MECAPRNISNLQLKNMFYQVFSRSNVRHVELTDDRTGMIIMAQTEPGTWICLLEDNSGFQEIYFRKEFLDGVIANHHNNHTDLEIGTYLLEDVILDKNRIRFYADKYAIAKARNSKLFDSVSKIKRSPNDEEYGAFYENSNNLFVPLYSYDVDRCLKDYFRGNRFIQMIPNENVYVPTEATEIEE